MCCSRYRQQHESHINRFSFFRARLALLLIFLQCRELRAVCSFLTHILIQLWWASVAMVSRYDLISNRRWKMRVFFPFWANKVQDVHKKRYNVKLCHSLMFSKEVFNFLLFMSNSEFWWFWIIPSLRRWQLPQTFLAHKEVKSVRKINRVQLT